MNIFTVKYNNNMADKEETKNGLKDLSSLKTIIKNKSKFSNTPEVDKKVATKVKRRILRKFKSYATTPESVSKFGEELAKATKKDEKRVKHYVFTYNNPPACFAKSDEFLATLKNILDIRYIAFQMEVAPTTKTLHYQGYFEFSKSLRCTTLQNRLKRFGIQMTIRYRYEYSTGQQASDYCTSKIYKGVDKGQVPGTTRIWGEIVKSRQRSDILDVLRMAKASYTVREAIDEAPNSLAKYYRYFKVCQEVYKQPHSIANRVLEIHQGRPGTGKTHALRKMLSTKRCYYPTIGGDIKWFDGYDGQFFALFDDYGIDGTTHNLSVFLKLTHKYTEYVEVKGARVMWEPVYIYLSTNYPIIDWWQFAPVSDSFSNKYNRRDRWASLEAVVRRITRIFVYTDENEKPKEVEDKWAYVYDIDNVRKDIVQRPPKYIVDYIVKKYKCKYQKKNAFDILMAKDEVLDIETGNKVKRSESRTYNYDDSRISKTKRDYKRTLLYNTEAIDHLKFTTYKRYNVPELARNKIEAHCITYKKAMIRKISKINLVISDENIKIILKATHTYRVDLIKFRQKRKDEKEEEKLKSTDILDGVLEVNIKTPIIQSYDEFLRETERNNGPDLKMVIVEDELPDANDKDMLDEMETLTLDDVEKKQWHNVYLENTVKRHQEEEDSKEFVRLNKVHEKM